uniref:Ig-like domain-containing protein n=1 Tax=Heterorhabditis bacteriophora TaxID=37862 RepID=A0A1I7X4A9_HETBA
MNMLTVNFSRSRIIVSGSSLMGRDMPPRIIDGPKREVVKSNEVATLWCEAVGVPQPNIVWMKDAKIITDTAVSAPPAITPEKMNVTTEPRKTVILPCDGTGIPEPVISWVKAPNIQIEANEKYQLLGTSLAIRNVLFEDAGFYHCIAKSEAGQAIGNRRLIVDSELDRSHANMLPQ